MTDHPRPASLARRAFPALAVLGASGALLTQLGGGEAVDAQATIADPASAGTTAGAATATTVPPATTTTRPGAVTGRVPATGATGSTAPTTTAPAAAATTAPAAAGGATTAAACTGTTYTGSSVTTRFGPVQVAVIVGADKTLCDVQVLAYPSDDRRSLSINQRALPTLRTEAVAAKSASIAGVTGATITSNAYKTSLQSALDQVR